MSNALLRLQITVDNVMAMAVLDCPYHLLEEPSRLVFAHLLVSRREPQAICPLTPPLPFATM